MQRAGARKWVTAATAGLAMSGVVIFGAGTSGAGASPPTGGSLTWGLESDSPGYVPGISSMLAYSGGAVEQAIYDPLTIYSASGAAVPFLAKTVVSTDGDLEWTVTLRSGTKFEDGTAVTGQDIADDYNDYYNSPGSAAAATYANVKSVAASGPLSATFTLDTADANFPVLLTTFYTFNPDIKTTYGSAYAAHPDGTGPFSVVSWTPNNQLVLKANPYYWRKDASGHKLPYVQNLTMKIIVSGSTRNATLESGGIDGYQSVEAPVVAQALRIPNAKVLLANTGGYGWFLDTAKAPTDDLRVRQALAYATSNAAVKASQGAGKVIQTMNQYFPATSPYYSKAIAAKYPTYNPTKAKAILKGYINDATRSDGASVGSPVAIQLDYLSGDPSSTAAVQVAQSEWDGVGFNVTLNALSEGSLIGAALTGGTQVFWFGWGSNAPYALFNHNYLAPTVDPTNWTKLNSTTVQNAITALSQCQTSSCTLQATDVIDQVFDNQLPVIFLMSTNEGWVYNSTQVGGVKLFPGGPAGLDPEIDWATIYAKK
jgi:peptide/nickel transport system substrate-binding protein